MRGVLSLPFELKVRHSLKIIVFDAARVGRLEIPEDGFFSVRMHKAHFVEVIEEQLVVTMWDTERGVRIVSRS